MLTATKLQQVQDARDSIQEAKDRIGDLIGDEPKEQPPGERVVALERIEADLEGIDETLDRLWS